MGRVSEQLFSTYLWVRNNGCDALKWLREKINKRIHNIAFTGMKANSDDKWCKSDVITWNLAMLADIMALSAITILFIIGLTL